MTSDDDKLEVWDATSGRQLKTLDGGGTEIRTFALSDEGDRIAAGYYKFAKTWDVRSGTVLSTLGGHSNSVYTVAFSPDGARVLSGDINGPVGIWDTVTGRLVRSFTPFGDNGLQSAAFSPDGAFALLGGYGNGVFIGGDNNGLRLVETKTWSTLKNLAGHVSTVSTVAFSKDGRRGLSGSWDGTIKLWDLTRGSLIRTLNGHAGHVNSVSFSPDNKLIVSGSSDTTIRIWNTRTGSC